MIPINLKISGFLSYHDPVELDFRAFDLACISGPNGAGKSSLLDAMTWALFGEARKRDESVINLRSKTALVEFTFDYEGSIYRVLRSQTRGKTTSLELQMSRSQPGDDGHAWHPLTEATMRQTEKRIEQILRMDYETFINVSFFLQGRADIFAQQNPTKRKEILASILGLEIWEEFKQRAADQRSRLDDERKILEGQIEGIDQELGQEQQRKDSLANLTSRLAELINRRNLQEDSFSKAKSIHASLENLRTLVKNSGDNLESLRNALQYNQERLSNQEGQRQKYASTMERAQAIEKAYQNWQAARVELERLDLIAVQFHDHEKNRQPYVDEINAEGARLEQERTTLQQQKESLSQQIVSAADWNKELDLTTKHLSELEKLLSGMSDLEGKVRSAGERQAELRATNENLKTEMELIKERMDRLSATEGATCPLCGQELTRAHQKATLAQLQSEGKSKGDAYRQNNAEIDALSNNIRELQKNLDSRVALEAERLKVSNLQTQLHERVSAHEKLLKEWHSDGEIRLLNIDKILSDKKFALEARKGLAQVDKGLRQLGYDVAAHAEAREREMQAREAEGDHLLLETARSALLHIDDEIKSLKSTIKGQQADVEKQNTKYQTDLESLKVTESQAPDINMEGQTLRDAMEEENSLRQEVGMATQKVQILDQQRERKQKIEGEIENIDLQISRYKSLERAFGKDGVPALLIEQALPMIEMKANQILGRLSDDSMHLHFETQSSYKDKKRSDMRETLEIQVSDGAGVRDYEMYSGGEAFRVNFAIRLALSEELASRKGARLQTLVIDEGFGSQDAFGRQRLIEAINAVKGDFAKILVITHMDELKDAFPARVEVEKTENGSTVKVI